jgi:hypothetical protein
MKNAKGVVLEAGDERIARLLRESGHLVLGEAGGNGVDHVCQPAVCAPSVACPGFNLYICKQNLLHVCSEQSCKLWRWDAQRQTCPISGIQYGNVVSEYIKDDPRTWGGSGGGGGGGTGKRLRTPKLTPSAAAAAAREHARERASAVVKHLLYSNARIECNRETLRANVEKGKEVRALYDANRLQHGQPSYWTDRYRIMGRWGTQPLPFVIYVFDQALHDYYTNVIVQVWSKVERHYVTDSSSSFSSSTSSSTSSTSSSTSSSSSSSAPMRADIDTIAVAVLYSMRNGFHYQGIQLLPKDDFILLNLPYVNQLPAFNIAKTCITLGQDIIARTFQLAIAKGVPAHELELAPEGLVQTPVQPIEDEEDDDEGGDEGGNEKPAATAASSIVLDSNGEKLYKLNKRKK